MGGFLKKIIPFRGSILQARFSALLKIQDRVECGNTQTELKKEEINHNAIYDYNNGSAVVVAYGVTNYSW